MRKIRCRAEPGEFPESEFRHDANGQLVIPYIHERGPDHFINGTPVRPPKDPSTSLLIRELQQELDSLILVKEPDPQTREIMELVWRLHNLAMGLPLESLLELVDRAHSMYMRLSKSDEERNDIR